jgi:hypothetical protein
LRKQQPIFAHDGGARYEKAARVSARIARVFILTDRAAFERSPDNRPRLIYEGLPHE